MHGLRLRGRARLPRLPGLHDEAPRRLHRPAAGRSSRPGRSARTARRPVRSSRPVALTPRPARTQPEPQLRVSSRPHGRRAHPDPRQAGRRRAEPRGRDRRALRAARARSCAPRGSSSPRASSARRTTPSTPRSRSSASSSTSSPPGPTLAFVLEGEGAIATARKTIGATNPADADPGSLRGEFALAMPNNLVHGSDSPESAEREIGALVPRWAGLTAPQRDRAEAPAIVLASTSPQRRAILEPARGPLRGRRAGVRGGAGRRPARARGRQGALGRRRRADRARRRHGRRLRRRAARQAARSRPTRAAMLVALSGATTRSSRGSACAPPSWEELGQRDDPGHASATLGDRDVDALPRARRVGGAGRRLRDPGARRGARRADRRRLPERRRAARRAASSLLAARFPGATDSAEPSEREQRDPAEDDRGAGEPPRRAPARRGRGRRGASRSRSRTSGRRARVRPRRAGARAGRARTSPGWRPRPRGVPGPSAALTAREADDRRVDERRPGEDEDEVGERARVLDPGAVDERVGGDRGRDRRDRERAPARRALPCGPRTSTTPAATRRTPATSAAETAWPSTATVAARVRPGRVPA